VYCQLLGESSLVSSRIQGFVIENLDLNLPRMSGIELLEQVRADPALTDLTVIVLTSSNEPSDRAAAFEYAVEDYIVKPHSFGELASAIGTVLNYALPQRETGSVAS